jgi:hypothetical protein
MSKFNLEVIENGFALSNDDLAQVLGGVGEAAGCGCKCGVNVSNLCNANAKPK